MVAVPIYISILAGVIFLCLGWGFWVYVFNTSLGLFLAPIILSYFYVAFEITRNKKWAWQISGLIVFLAMIFFLLFLFSGGIQEGFFEWFSISIVIISSVVLTILGSSCFIRKIIYWVNQNNKKAKFIS